MNLQCDVLLAVSIASHCKNMFFFRLSFIKYLLIFEMCSKSDSSEKVFHVILEVFLHEVVWCWAKDEIFVCKFEFVMCKFEV